MVGDPTDEILAAASRLIGELGVGGTPISRIASEVGLKQSSLYYYFRRKEEILAALVARANVVPLELVRTVAADGGSAGAQLHRFVQADVAALCSLPFDINDIHRIVTNLGVLDVGGNGDTLRLLSVHPGVTVDEVREASGCEIQVDADVSETREPSMQELVLIREVLDPKGLRDREVPA